MSVVLFPLDSSAFNIKDLLKNNGDVVSGIIDGVLTRSNISISDMAGSWTVEGSAVSFKSENALAKAGGIAAASAVESKINPYFKQYGLTGGTMTISEDGNFSMGVKGINLSGTIEKKGEDGTFEFNFKALGMKITSLTAYVEKSPSALKIMFDATKLKTLLQAVAKFSGSQLTQSAVSLLDQYDGLCVGFSMNGTGNSSTVPSILSPSKDSDNNSNSDNSESTQSGNGLGSLFDILKKVPVK